MRNRTFISALVGLTLVSSTKAAEPGKFVVQQPLWIQDLDRAMALGTFHNAVQESRIDGARTGSMATAIGLFLNQIHRSRSLTRAKAVI